MKHGRRHNKLKEQTYGQRFSQDAEGYSRPYRPIDVAQGDGAARSQSPPTELPLAFAMNKKAARQLKRMGIDPDADDETPA